MTTYALWTNYIAKYVQYKKVTNGKKVAVAECKNRTIEDLKTSYFDFDL